MGIQAQNIVIAFRSIQPEQLHMCLQQRASYNHKNDAISSHNISESIFQSLAYTQYPTYSHEEIANIYNILCEQMESPDKRHPGVCPCLTFWYEWDNGFYYGNYMMLQAVNFLNCSLGAMYIRIWVKIL